MALKGIEKDFLDDLPCSSKAKKSKTQKITSPALKKLCESIANDLSFEEKRKSVFDSIVASLVGKKFEGFTCFVLPVSSKEKWMEISRDMYDRIPPLSSLPVKSSRVLLSNKGTIAFEVFGRTVVRKDQLHPLDWQSALDEQLTLLDDSFSFCKGILSEEHDQFSSSIRSDYSSLIRVDQPFQTYRSLTCAMWSEKKCLRLERCQFCNSSLRNLKRRNVRNAEAALNDQPTSSNVNFKFLSPTAQSRRLRKNTKSQSKLAANTVCQLKQRILNTGLVVLNEKQREDMLEIARLISTEHSIALQETIIEASMECDSDEFGETLKLQWEADQKRNRTGSKSNRWSVASIRLAMAVYSRSQAAYDALCHFPMLQLPSARTLQKVVSSNFVGEQGVNQEYLAMQSKLYDDEAKRKEKAGQRFGVKYGCLIFDEIKIVSKIAWNSKNGQMYGLASSIEDLASLHDIFEDLTNQVKSEPAEYCLQTMWRDCSSNFDIAGPYWLSAKTINASRLAGCIMESMRAFESFGFKIGALICDGASYNLRLLKNLCSHFNGPLEVGEVSKEEDRFLVPCVFRHPFHPSDCVHVIPCPSHMLKNMINLLFASQPSHGRQLQLRPGSAPFGWEIIREMWQREILRRNSSLSQRVTGLNEADIERDQWTKLSVLPAKKMQQRQVIAELVEHANSKPFNHQPVIDTSDFLIACNNLFENGFLSHEKISTNDKSVVQRIKIGCKFFTDWFARLEKLPDFCPKSTKEKRFMSWQTFDLMRLSVYGFTGFTDEFLKRYPDHYLIPFKVNGSAVESYFAQIRQRAGVGAISGISYPQAAARVAASNTTDIRKRKAKKDDGYRFEELALKRRK